MKHPGYAIAGALTLPVAVGVVAGAISPGGRRMTREAMQGRAWQGVGVGVLASYGTFLYAERAELSEETRSFLEAGATAVGAITLLVTIPLLLKAGSQT